MLSEITKYDICDMMLVGGILTAEVTPTTINSPRPQ